MHPSLIKVGSTIYRSVKRGRINREKGIVLEKTKLKHCLHQFKVQWDSGVITIEVSKDLRITPPESAQGEKTRYQNIRAKYKCRRQQDTFSAKKMSNS